MVNFAINMIKTMEEKHYVSPYLKMMELCFEGILCASNESLEENEGVW
jgi:hypothetical protein